MVEQAWKKTERDDATSSTAVLLQDGPTAPSRTLGMRRASEESVYETKSKCGISTVSRAAALRLSAAGRASFIYGTRVPVSLQAKTSVLGRNEKAQHAQGLTGMGRYGSVIGHWRVSFGVTDSASTKRNFAGKAILG